MSDDVPPSLTDRRNAHALQEMTWPQAKRALEHAKVAIIPVGSTEQHGRHLRLSTDTVIAEQLALRIAQALTPHAIVVPAVPFGVSYHHMDFPGTLTLSPDTLQAVVTDLVESLQRHGVQRQPFCTALSPVPPGRRRSMYQTGWSRDTCLPCLTRHGRQRM